MEGRAKRLIALMSAEDRRFIIPVYQRNYEWKLENCAQLYNDLVAEIKENKESHFFGSIVSHNHGKDEVILIDGQQRITTISLILIAMVKAMQNRLVVSENSQLADKIWKRYIINEYQSNENKVRLKPFRNDNIAFNNLIFKDEKDYIQGSIVTRNYQFFFEKITKSQDLSIDELFCAIEGLLVIDIELDEKDNPQLIFESLNSTGLDLTESDKIRNYVLMNQIPKVQEEFYDKYWNKIETLCGSNLDGFIRNYLTVKDSQVPNLKDIYSAFKKYASKNREIEPILSDMLVYAEAFNKIKSYNTGIKSVDEIAKRLDKLDMTVAYPFLMALLVYAESENLPEADVCGAFSCVETFVFRRFICGWGTNALNKIFATLHRSILKYKTTDNSYLSIMICLLENRKASGAFPTDAEFSEGFTTRNVYAMSAKNKAYLFERLENESSVEKNDIYKNIDDGTLTVEHIMPQTLSQEWKDDLGAEWQRVHDTWLHKIANLTLTGYNSQYSNRSFQEKKNMERGFEKSGLRLNHEIAQCDKWTEMEIQSRNDRLLKLALSVWNYPTTDFVIPVAEGNITSLADDNDVNTGKKIQWYEFKGLRYNVQDWSDMMMSMMNNLYNINPDVLYEEAKSTNNVWFSVSDSQSVRKIAEGLYFCTQSSTWTKMAILKKLFERYEIDEDELHFGLRPYKEEE